MALNHWYSIRLNASHYKDICDDFRLSSFVLYSSMSNNGTIRTGTSGIPLNPLAFHRYSIGKMHIIKGLRVFAMALGCVVVHSSCPLVPMLRLDPME